MSGSVQFKKDRLQWVVAWIWQKKRYQISRYKGQLMKKTHPNKKKDQGYINACRLLAQMQGDVENGVFRMEKYTGLGHTDVLPYFEKWLERKKKKKPSTYQGYKASYNNWIKPFFENKNIQLHEIQLDTLDELLDYITLAPKSKHNIMMCFHAFMDYAWRSRRIPAMPPFPKKSEYNLVEPVIDWLPEVRQMKIIEAIPEQDRPIFLFMKYTARRPGEAMALHKIDYDRFGETFLIRRTISYHKVVNSTKTGVEHVIPCHSALIDTIKELLDANPKSPFMFVNQRSTSKHKRYSHNGLNKIWKKACQAVGEDISLYSGLKHSTLSQFYNEKGLSVSDIQDISDHARLESVRRYTKTEVARKRELFEAKPTLQVINKRSKANQS